MNIDVKILNYQLNSIAHLKRSLSMVNGIYLWNAAMVQYVRINQYDTLR
jgi:hypothetical protein